jgi:hypothetical protein
MKLLVNVRMAIANIMMMWDKSFITYDLSPPRTGCIETMQSKIHHFE